MSPAPSSHLPNGSRLFLSITGRFCVDFSFCCIIKLLGDSLEQNICWSKTSFGPTNSWTSSGVRENWNQHLVNVLGGSMCMLRPRCCLSMLHRTCEHVHGGDRLSGMGMPNILHIPFYFKSRGVKKCPMPYMVQIELTYISMKIVVVNPNVDRQAIYWLQGGDLAVRNT